METNKQHTTHLHTPPLDTLAVSTSQDTKTNLESNALPSAEDPGLTTTEVLGAVNSLNYDTNMSQCTVEPNSDECVSTSAPERPNSPENSFSNGVPVFSSDDELDRECDRTVSKKALTRSLGRNEFSRIVVSKTRKAVGDSVVTGKYLPGKIISLPDGDVEIDARVQSTISLLQGKGKAWKRGGTPGPKDPIVVKPMGTGPSSTMNAAKKQSLMSSPKTSPSHTVNSSSRLQASPSHSSSRGSMTPSPETKRKSKLVESNPFFKHDQLMKMQQSPEKTIPNGTASPTGMKRSHTTANVTSRVLPVNSRSLSDVVQKSENEQPSEPATEEEPLSIKVRIKLWVDKEREAKEIQEQEIAQKRKLSNPSVLDSFNHNKNDTGAKPHEVAKSSSEVREDECQIAEDDNVYEVIPADMVFNEAREIAPALPPRNTKNFIATVAQPNPQNQVITSPTMSPKRGKVFSKSSPKSSPKKMKNKEPKDRSNDNHTHLSPKSGRSKWKLSPRLGRKKKGTDSYDETDNPQLEKISNRSSKKRVAIKKKPSTSTSQANDAAPSKQLDGNEDDVYDDIVMGTSKLKMVERKRASSLTLTQCNKLVDSPKRRSDSQPIDPDILLSVSTKYDDRTYMYTAVSAHHLDPDSEKFKKSEQPQSDVVISIAPPSDSHQAGDVLEEGDFAAPLPSVFKRSERGRSQKSTVDRTISRDIRDIIDSLGTGQMGSQQSTNRVSKTPSPKFGSRNISQSDSLEVPADIRSSMSDSALNLIGDDQEVLRSSKARQASPDLSGDSSSDTETNESSLDKGSVARDILKQRASDSSTAVLSTTIKEPLGSPSHDQECVSPADEATEGVIATSLMYADAVWDRAALDNDELSFRVGDVIEILDMTDDVWWHGSVGEKAGWFPASFVRLRIGQEDESDSEDSAFLDNDVPLTENEKLPQPEKNRLSDPTADASHKDSHNVSGEIDTVPDELPRSRTLPRQTGFSVRRRVTIRRKDTTPSVPRKLTPTEVRAKVVEEILNTERDYVRNLEHIIEGYLKPCREYSQLFDKEKVEVIFSNVEQIYLFQRDFLRELETRVITDHMADSQIGEVFVLNKHEFHIYSQYCNNHPHAVNEMNALHQNEQYTFFFESCRLLRNLQDISLEGFLLTPVQKICKYPLQLSELLKYTAEDHVDYRNVVAAQEAMKEVALLINDQKRRMENIGKIGRWQETIDGWKGEDILQASTELIHSGELHKISRGHSQERYFFLFDHQLVYCKKEIGGKLSYKGRLNTDECNITDVNDGQVYHGGNPVKNAWRMNNATKDKWYIIFAKTPETKNEWMKAFEIERKRVTDDKEKGFHVPLKMKKATVSLCASMAESRKRRRSFHKKHALFTESVDSGMRHKIELSSSSNKKFGVSVGPQVMSQTNKKSKGNRKKSQSGSSQTRVL